MRWAFTRCQANAQFLRNELHGYDGTPGVVDGTFEVVSDRGRPWFGDTSGSRDLRPWSMRGNCDRLIGKAKRRRCPMKITIVYESMFGSTRAIAEAIGEGCGQWADVEVVSVADADPGMVDRTDVLVVGGPTHAWGMSRPSTRKGPLVTGTSLLVTSYSSRVRRRDQESGSGSRVSVRRTLTELPSIPASRGLRLSPAAHPEGSSAICPSVALT